MTARRKKVPLGFFPTAVAVPGWRKRLWWWWLRHIRKPLDARLWDQVVRVGGGDPVLSALAFWADRFGMAIHPQWMAEFVVHSDDAAIQDALTFTRESVAAVFAVPARMLP